MLEATETAEARVELVGLGNLSGGSLSRVGDGVGNGHADEEEEDGRELHFDVGKRTWSVDLVFEVRVSVDDDLRPIKHERHAACFIHQPIMILDGCTLGRRFQNKSCNQMSLAVGPCFFGEGISLHLRRWTATQIAGLRMTVGYNRSELLC